MENIQLMVEKLFIIFNWEYTINIKINILRKDELKRLPQCIFIFFVPFNIFNIYPNISTQLDQTFCTSDHYSFECQNNCGHNIFGIKSKE